MEKVVIKVEGMSCQHCVKAIEGAVGPLEGVTEVAVDLNRGTVSVNFDPGKMTLEYIKQEICDQGYDVS